MNPELLSRFQFGLTASFHYIYPPISIGLGLMLVVLGVIYVRTGNPQWRQLSFFWVRIYGLVFALGIATGVVMEFEFGMNWANYSRFVGNIFGSLLAAEGIFAFFLEGGFLGLMLFGGNRLGPRLWLLATFLVAFGAHFSALWIVMANAWQQTPTGYTLAQTPSGTIAFMTSFWEAMATPAFLTRIGHVYVSAWMVGASLVLSVSAWYLLKRRYIELATAAIKVALPVFFVLSVLQLIVFGSESAVAVLANQPAKLAAMEGVWPVSQSCAPMFIVGWVDVANQTTTGLSIPCMLSLLAAGSLDAPITGLNAFAPDLWAPIQLVFQAYHVMINLGMLFILIGLLGVFFWIWGGRLFRTRWMLWLLVLSIVLTEAATITGWWTAEFGRQPWIVYNLLKTVDGVSPLLTVEQVVFSVGTFIVMYIILFILFLFLLNEKIQHGPDPLEEETPITSLPDNFREIFRHRAARA